MDSPFQIAARGRERQSRNAYNHTGLAAHDPLATSNKQETMIRPVDNSQNYRHCVQTHLSGFWAVFRLRVDRLNYT